MESFMEDAEKQSLKIASCPVCSEEHSYTLRVKRSRSIGLITSWESNPKPRRIKMTRLFTCPIKNQDFQVTFSLSEWPHESITSVEVERLSNRSERDSSNGQKPED